MGRKCRFGSGCSSGTVRVSSENSSTSSASAQQRGYFVVCAVSIMCYANALNGDMVHDDIPAIVRNSDVLGTTSLHQLLKNDFWGYPMHDINSHKSYRPVTTFTFRLNHSLDGLEPFWYHVANVLIHAVCCVLFTRASHVVANLNLRFAILAGLMFATHPVHTEAVTSIVGRADVLSSFFFLLSFLSYHDSKWKQTNLSCCFAGLSMLAKETGVTVLVINLVYDFYKSWQSIKRGYSEGKWNEGAVKFVRRAAKVFMTIGVLLIFRVAMLQGTLPRFLPQDNPAAFQPCYYVRLLTFCYLAALNVWLLLCPATLSHDWQMGSIPLVASLADYRNIATCFLLAVCVWIAYRLLIDFEQQRHAPLLLGCLMSVLPFLPASNLFVTVGFVVAERILYIPSMGVVLLVIYGAQLLSNWYPQSRNIILSSFFVLLVLFAARTLIRNKDWKSRETLSRAGLKALPQNAKMHYNWANFQRDSGNPLLARYHYSEALRLWPSYASAHNNLGTLMKSASQAEAHFISAIRSNPGHVNAHYNLGHVYRKLNRSEDAKWMLEKCLRLNSGYTQAYLLLAKIHSGPIVGRLLHQVARLHPSNPEYLAYYAGWLRKNQRIPEAVRYYEKSLRLKNDHQASLSGLARCFRDQGHILRYHQIFLRSYRIRTLDTHHVTRSSIRLQEALNIHRWELYKQGQVTSVSSIKTTIDSYHGNLPMPSLFLTRKSNSAQEDSSAELPEKNSIRNQDTTDIKPG